MIKELKATIESNDFSAFQYQLIKKTILESGITATVRDDAIYIAATLDDGNGFIDSLAWFISSQLTYSSREVVFNIIEENVFIETGDIVDGYYDYVINSQGVFKRDYVAVKSDVSELVRK